MEFLLSTVVSSIMISCVLWLMKNWLLTRISLGIKHEYDEKLEELRSDLKAKETQIEAIRRGALNGIADKQKILHEYRVKAAEELWASVLALAPAKQTSGLISVVKYEQILEYSKDDPRVKDMFTMLDKNDNLDYWKESKAFKTRLFLSELSWALYFAYSSILGISVLRMQTLKIGLSEDFTKGASILQVVKKVLPHQEEFINQHGINGLHYLLEELELSILNELKSVLDGKDTDKESILRASEIIAETEKLMKNV
ncbi:MAG: hypothetical protein Q8O20_04465 [Sulfuricurvum sp.]|uniref:hypothetical protein n=1 Tax=Sulfuricurvum sp. TaxID=2025608 RepID=UPI002733D63C|nr:hypothetical protein [Sulfuricurvum sp.]MDP2850306.1 hypothetical protein [Sulfuricurvum sp.]